MVKIPIAIGLFLVVGISIVIGLSAISLRRLDLSDLGSPSTVALIESTDSPKPNPTLVDPKGYSVVLLPIPADALGGDALAINASGLIAGSVSAVGWQKAVVWDQDRLTALPNLEFGGASAALAIDSAGGTAGWAESAAGIHHAVRWDSGTITDLGTLGGTSSEASDCNSVGQVVGWAETEAGTTHAFVWADGVMRDLGVLDEVEGESAALAINESGTIAGWATGVDSVTHPVVWIDGVMHKLRALRTHKGGIATDLNDTGQFVGELSLSLVAVRWSDEQVVELFATVSPPGASAVAVNDVGQVLAENGADAVLLDSDIEIPLPAPASKGLMDFLRPSDLNGFGVATGSLVRVSGWDLPVRWDPPRIATLGLPADVQETPQIPDS